MTRNRLHLVIALAIGVVLLAGGFFLGVQPQLAAASANREQLRTIDATNDGYRTELARLAARSAKLPAMQREADALATSIPSSADTASFYKEVDRVAAAAGVTVDGITTSWAAAYTPPETAAPAAAASAAEPGATSGSATPSPSATPTTPAAAAPVTDPKITAANFSTIAISIGVTGSFEQALAFTSGMQDGDRLFLVDDIKSTREDTTADGATTTDGAAATSGSGSTTWTLSGYVYVLSDAAAAQASQGSGQGTGTPSDAATSTPSDAATSTSAQG